MGTQADITLTAQNSGPSDAAAIARLSAVDISDLTTTFDLTVASDTTVAVVPGTIVRTIQVTFDADFQARFPTTAEQAAALRGTFKGVATPGADHPQITEAITIT